MTRLHTPRMMLSPSEPQDRDDFIALERDPEVMRFLNGGRDLDPERVDPDADYLMPRGTEPHVWTGRMAADGAFVGWFCLWPDDGRRAELGYRLRRDAWGRGLASEGAVALVDWGFREAGYDTVTASTMAVNHASRRVMEKIGLRYARTEHPRWLYPIPGAEQGEVWYEATRASWRRPP
ncbi:GNAT family N-acetyltransferase [Rhizobium sp. TRM95796]|uniref:GNAT family N-acetyltransferase n=1 Tax=Rhizobium sp. TRM95796 TaxID=2979862 RepID=UPI0021E81563|nr:GNAT family N-acetyltransferase [Rhizobium sp. TRM95796]MCV3766416.1 GNAT family N-acetyltransferase [Rhizobium sp. TRM95796]